jgi:hypothetical protein
VLAGYRHLPRRIRGVHKGKTIKARVRQNGSIRYAGRIFNSPSMAAKAVVGRNINGWVFWTYEQGPGYWVKLSELKRR